MELTKTDISNVGDPPLAERSPRELRGRRLGRFLVLGPLGSGGMGTVVEAHDEELDRTVALKLLHPDAARRYEARLVREAQALARLSHPNVVQVYEIGTIGSQTFIAMELVHGQSLGDWAEEPRSWRRVTQAYLQAAEGLAAAHHKGLVHRDFKPDNCMIGEDGRVRVLDFGLARGVGSESEDRRPTDQDTGDLAEQDTARRRSSSLGEALTQAGAILGTLAYMPLEQLRGDIADERSDQFSFCASLFEGLFGCRPYEASSHAKLMGALIDDERSKVDPSKIPRRLHRAIWRGLALSPKDRWPSMDELIVELSAVLRRRRWWKVAGAVGVGAALGGGVVLAQVDEDRCTDSDRGLDEAWDEDARRGILTAFDRHGVEDAQGLSTRVVVALDRYADQWGQMSRASCEATFDTNAQSQRMYDIRAACLQRHRNRFEFAIDALREADDATALVASAIVPFKLPLVAECGDVEALAAGREPAADPEVRRRDDELRQAIDHAVTLRDAGQMQAALVLASEVNERAEATGETYLRAEALECLGRIQAEGGSLREASETLEKAVLLASEASNDALVARAWLSLLYAATMRGQLEQAKHQTLAVTAAVERTSERELEAWRLNNLGILASESGDFARSREHFERALAIKTDLLGPQHVDVGISWFNLGMMLSNSGDNEAAFEPIARSRAIFESTVGYAHPMYAYAVSGLCNVEYGRGNIDAAVELCQITLTRLEAMGAQPMWESRVRFTLAEVLWKQQRVSEARAMATAAAEVIAADDPKRAKSISDWVREHPLTEAEQAEPGPAKN